MWPEWFTPEFWDAVKRKQPPRNWAALYQQMPVPDEGTYFKRDWFWRFDNAPKVRKYLTSDFAVTEPEDDSDPDYTEIGVHGAAKTDDGLTKIYLGIDGWSGQSEPATWMDEYFNLVKRHKPLCEFAEVGVIRRSIEGFLKQKRRERKAIGRIEWMPHIGDKLANARALQGMAEMGLIGISSTPYGDHLLEQLLKFPAGKHDDAVDMCAMMARVIDEAHPAVTLPHKPKAKPDRYDRAFKAQDEAASWRV